MTRADRPYDPAELHTLTGMTEGQVYGLLGDARRVPLLWWVWMTGGETVLVERFFATGEPGRAVHGGLLHWLPDGRYALTETGVVLLDRWAVALADWLANLPDSPRVRP